MLGKPHLGLLLLVRLASVIRVRRRLKKFQRLGIAESEDIGFTALADGLLRLEAEPFTADKDVHDLPPRARMADDG